jgi:hypothetical protein
MVAAAGDFPLETCHICPAIDLLNGFTMNLLHGF